MSKVSLQETLGYIDTKAPELGVDPSLVKTMLLAENMDQTRGVMPSMLDATKKSDKGAVGIMQVMPATRAGLIKQGFLPADHDFTSWQGQVDAGIAAIKESMSRLRTNDPAAIGVDYNAGPSGSSKFLRGELDRLPPETRNYLTRMQLAGTMLSPAASQGMVRKVDNAIMPESGAVAPGTRTTISSIRGIDDLKNLFTDYKAQAENLVKSLTSNFGDEQAAATQLATDIEAAGAAQADVARQKGVIEAANTQMRQRALDITNLDTNKVDNVMAQLVGLFNELDPQRQQLAATIDAKMGVGLLDNPLEWLVNQTQLPGLVNQHNAMARKQNEAMTTLSTLQAATRATQDISISATADMQTKQAAFLANAFEKEAAAKASEARFRAAGIPARLGTVIAQLNEREFDNAVKLAQIEKVMTLTKASNADEERAIAEQDQQIRRIGTLIGAPNASRSMIQGLSKKDQDEWKSRMMQNSIGGNIYEAVSFIRQYGNFGTMAATGNAELAKVLQELESEMRRRAGVESAKIRSQGGKMPSERELMYSVSQDIANDLAATSTNMLMATKQNPYLLNHKSMAVGAFRGDPNNPVLQNVKTMVAANIEPTDKVVFDSVVQSVVQGKVAPKDAALAVSEYYAAGVRNNNDTRAFTTYGLSMQQSYSILPRSSKLSVDLTKPGEVEKVLTQVAINQKLGNSAGMRDFRANMGMPTGFAETPGGGVTGFTWNDPATGAEP